jgi:hypothetical protein
MKSDTEYALDALEDAQKIMIERGKSYKGNQGKTAQVLDILFKDVTIRNVYDRKRYKIISNIVEKLCRYVLNWNKNGHSDSTADGTNYFCLLEAADRQNADEEKLERAIRNATIREELPKSFIDPYDKPVPNYVYQTNNEYVDPIFRDPNVTYKNPKPVSEIIDNTGDKPAKSGKSS